MPKEFEVRLGETYAQWWSRVNEIPMDPQRAREGTIIEQVAPWMMPSR